MNVQSHSLHRTGPEMRVGTHPRVTLLPVEMDPSLEDQEIGMHLPFAPVATTSSRRVKREGLARLGGRLRLGMVL